MNPADDAIGYARTLSELAEDCTVAAAEGLHCRRRGMRPLEAFVNRIWQHHRETAATFVLWCALIAEPTPEPAAHITCLLLQLLDNQRNVEISRTLAAAWFDFGVHARNPITQAERAQIWTAHIEAHDKQRDHDTEWRHQLPVLRVLPQHGGQERPRLHYPGIVDDCIINARRYLQYGDKQTAMAYAWLGMLRSEDLSPAMWATTSVMVAILCPSSPLDAAWRRIHRGHVVESLASSLDELVECCESHNEHLCQPTRHLG